MSWMVRLALLFLLTWPTLAVAGRWDGAPGQFRIQCNGERLTLEAWEVPQQQLLEALAQSLDFELILMGPLPQLRSLQIEGRPWEQALKQVLSPASWALKYTRAGGQDRLVQVVVFPSELRPPAEPRGAPDPAEPAPPQLTMVQPPEERGEDQAQQEESVGQEETEASGQDAQESQSIPSPGTR
jgi:hypothetical protein